MRCKDRIKIIYPENVYTLRETLFEKLDGFNIDYTKEQTLFKNVAIFDFESICVPSEELKPTETITWIGKHEPISVSISSNLLDKPFFCDQDSQPLIIDFVANLELLAESRMCSSTMFRRQMLFFLHSEEFLHDEMGSCYTSNHIVHLWISKTEL